MRQFGLQMSRQGGDSFVERGRRKSYEVSAQVIVAEPVGPGLVREHGDNAVPGRELEAGLFRHVCIHVQRVCRYAAAIRGYDGGNTAMARRMNWSNRGTVNAISP